MKNLLTILFVLITGAVISQSLPQKYNLDNQIIKHKGYVLSYNETCEQPNWVHYMVTEENLKNKVAERKNNFKSDKSVKSGSATPDDYKSSGYDRGHLASAADFVHDQVLMDESFYMSNMSPQHPSFNRGMWKKLEMYVRDLALENDTVYVITGAELNPQLDKIGENEVCIPQLYYKIILDKNGKVIGSYLMSNKKLSGKISDYKQPVEVIETMVGIDFMVD